MIIIPIIIFTLKNIANAKSEAIAAIGKIAFTNVNKVRSKARSQKEFFKRSEEPLVKALLKSEMQTKNKEGFKN